MVVAGALLLAMGLLPHQAQATIGTSCKNIGQTQKVLVKKVATTLTCTKVGKRARWTVVQSQPNDATIFLPGAEKFTKMAAEVKSWEAQCMYVMRDGKVIGEWNFAQHKTDSNVEGASVTKSFASTLVGIASRKGLLNIDESASKYITEWAGTDKRAITIRHLLAMTSGLNEWVVPGGSWYGQGDVRGTVISATMRQNGPDLLGNFRSQIPGQSWAYLNINTASLELVLARATGESVQSFASRELFQPLGMSVDIMTDSKNVPALAIGFRIGCDDLAKLVQLYMNGGVWNGAVILAPAYVRDATSPQNTCPNCSGTGWERVNMNGAYGLQWWVNAVAPAACHGLDPFCNITSAPNRGPTMPDLPADMFYASGACSQLGAGIPSAGVVVVVLRRGCDIPGEAVVYFNNRTPALVFFKELATAIR